MSWAAQINKMYTYIDIEKNGEKFDLTGISNISRKKTVTVDKTHCEHLSY